MLAILIRVISSGTHTAGRTPYTCHSLGPVLLQRWMRGQPFAAPPVDCRAQDIQIIPSHTAIPAPAQQTIVKEQLQTASAESPTVRVAAMTQPSAGQSLNIPTDVITTTTNANRDPTLILGPTTRVTILVTLP